MRFARLAIHSVAALSLGVAGQAQAFDLFGGVVGAVTNVFSQVSGRIGDSFSHPQDLQKERDKYFDNIQVNAEGLAPEQRAALVASVRAQWPAVEHQLLVRNAQLAQRKSAPLIDVTEAAKAGAGSVMTAGSIAAITSPNVIQNAVSSGAMDGVMSGLSGTPARAEPINAAYVPAGIGGTAGAELNARLNVASATQTGVSNGVSSFVKSLFHSSGDSGSSHAELVDAIRPDDFDGRKPATLHASDLYALCGNLGWHQEMANAKMQFYVPVISDPNIVGVVFTLDRAGGVTGAAKFVKLGVADFATIVNAVTKQKGEAPRYTASGPVSRAVWQDGTFVSVDQKNFSLGWSQTAIRLWQKESAM